MAMACFYPSLFTLVFVSIFAKKNKKERCMLASRVDEEVEDELR
jgi:hypothetical protein